MEVGKRPTFFLVEEGKIEVKNERELIKGLWNMIEPVVASEGMEIIELEFRREPQGQVLRIYIDHPDGVTVEDCATVSRVVGDFLDVVDPIHHTYHLEISSPGIDRPLRKPEHFLRYVGSIVRIRTVEPVEGRKNFKGILVGVLNNVITIECEGRRFEVSIANIEKGRLLYFETEEFLEKSRGKNLELPF